MSITKIILVIVVATLAGGVVGALIGWGLGVYTPSLFGALLPHVHNPVETGLGLGIVNGLLFGFLLGVLIVLVVSFGKKRDQ